MNIYFSENVKRLRKERDLTQEALADFLSVSFQAVSKWESGKSEPDKDHLVMLSGLLGLSLEELLADRPAPDRHEPQRRGGCRDYAGCRCSFRPARARGTSGSRRSSRQELPCQA